MNFLTGKASTPLYYILVLFQLTLLTPWLVRIIKGKRRGRQLLWLVTPLYLLYLYIWNLTTGSAPLYYETWFPAWFGFYYLGLRVRCGLKFQCNIGMLFSTLVLCCGEALLLKRMGAGLSFYTSQIRFGSFLYAAAFIGLLLKFSERPTANKEKILLCLGNCSYGIYYSHMIILIIINHLWKRITYNNWWVYWGITFMVTTALSFGIVCIMQHLLKHHRKLLRMIGFV